MPTTDREIAESAEFRPATRTQESLLAPLERRALTFLAGRTPGRVTPDHLTALAFAANAAAGVCYALASTAPAALLGVNVCLAANWLGDSLDGTLARYRGKQRPRYGYYVDHMSDAFGALFVLGGLAASGFVSPWVAAAYLVVFLLFSIDAYLATYSVGDFRLSHWKFSPTEMRVLLAVGNCFAYARPHVRLFDRELLFFDVGFAVATVATALVLVGSVARTTARLYRTERV